MEEGFITVTDIKHYAYCEAIIYITHVLGIAESTTEYMEYGSEVERDKSLGSIIAKFKVSEILKKPQLISREIMLCGSPDYIIRTNSGELIPVEIKWSEPSKHGRGKKDHVIQLAAYALLIEKCFRNRKYSVKKGVLYYLRPEGKLVVVNIDYELKAEVLKILRIIKEIINGKREPKTAKSKCPSCNYRNYCPWKKESPRK